MSRNLTPVPNEQGKMVTPRERRVSRNESERYFLTTYYCHASREACE